MSIAVIINRKAGYNRAASIAPYLVQRLTEANISFIEISESSQELAAQKVRDLSTEIDTLLAVGGDGTVHFAAQLAWAYGHSFGIIPAGSGDDIARACGLPHGRNLENVKAAVDHFITAYLSGQSLQIDGIRVVDAADRHRLVLAVVSCGFDSRVSIVGSKVTFPRGTMRYVYSMFATLAQFSPMEYRITVNDKTELRRGMLLDIANGSTYGGGMRISPTSKIDDGKIEFLFLEPVGIPTLLLLFSKIFKGTHLEHPKVSVESITEIRLDACQEQVWGDGEYLAHTPVTVSVVPQALRVVGARTQ